MKELRRMLTKETRKAMGIISEKALADMMEETYDFYVPAPGVKPENPKRYDRTGALGDTPITTAVTASDSEIYFDAYLNLSHNYTTGSKPSMLDVLNLANDAEVESSVGFLRRTHGEKVHGKGHFWERAEVKMEKSLKDVMKKFFEEIT